MGETIEAICLIDDWNVDWEPTIYRDWHTFKYVVNHEACAHATNQIEWN